MNRRNAIVASVLIVIVASLAVTAFFVADGINDKDSTKIVTNKEMNIIGTETDGIVSFKGIPYGEAPVGDLRFAPPVAKKMWTETLDCTKFGNIAIQGELYKTQPTGIHGANESEDCLNLNIWAPANAKSGSNLPVYVWIHGGGYVGGSGQEPDFDGTAFARDGVILVTFNYRIGALGFLALESFTDDNALGTTGTWGLLDQILALKWVQDNIGKFGGDKDNVTIGGESAGAFSVFSLICSPLAKGLFSKAILESGAITHYLESTASYDGAVEVSRRVAAKFGADDSAEGIAKLRDADPYKISDVTSYASYTTKDHSYSVWPVYDDVVIPKDRIKALENGEYNHVPVIIGYNTYEGQVFTDPNVTQEQFEALIDQNFTPEDAASVKQYYESRTGMSVFEKTAELTSMVMFKLGIDKIQKLLSKETTVYAFEFTHKLNDGTVPYHSVEIAFAFGQDSCNGVPFDGNDRIIRDLFHGSFVNFIKKGDPNGEGIGKWDKYSEDKDLVMSFAKQRNGMFVKLEAPVLKVLSPYYFNWSYS